MSDISLAFSSDAIERLADAIAERLGAAIDPGDRSEVQRWPAFMSVETASAYLDVSVERIRKLKERQEIPFIQEAPGHRVLFARRDLDDWMASLRRGRRGGDA